MINVVWLKRDIRLTDHKPFIEASKQGAVLPIYIAEPSIWKEPDLSLRHFTFVQEGLVDLAESVRKVGGKLYVGIGEMEDILQAIYDTYGPFRMYAHEENGTPATFARDLRVHRWMRDRELTFMEYPQFGVVRKLRSRDIFHEEWASFMAKEVLAAPQQMRPVEKVPSCLKEDVSYLQSFRVKGARIQSGQEGGEIAAFRVLESFFGTRFSYYNVHISKPFESAQSCSRLSPYLAFGNISIRTVVQRTQLEMKETRNDFQKKQLQAFYSRLHWHCHFIQRLETEPEITTKAMNEAYDAIRTEWDEKACQRWFYGMTGIPLVDAAMRCLHETGWVNFRTRAMLVSFVCNTLQLDWRRPAQGLAQLFLDYEPGIHFSQVQMQAGTTGFNTIRVYNPIKMGKEKDPNGRFVRRFVKELRDVPDEYIHEPWLYEKFDQLNYPSPMVDIVEANRAAREMLYSVKKSKEARAISAQQLEEHGSRRKSSKKKKRPTNGEQLSLDI